MERVNGQDFTVGDVNWMGLEPGLISIVPSHPAETQHDRDTKHSFNLSINSTENEPVITLEVTTHHVSECNTIHAPAPASSTVSAEVLKALSSTVATDVQTSVPSEPTTAATGIPPVPPRTRRISLPPVVSPKTFSYIPVLPTARKTTTSPKTKAIIESLAESYNTKPMPTVDPEKALILPDINSGESRPISEPNATAESHQDSGVGVLSREVEVVNSATSDQDHATPSETSSNTFVSAIVMAHGHAVEALENTTLGSIMTAENSNPNEILHNVESEEAKHVEKPIDSTPKSNADIIENPFASPEDSFIGSPIQRHEQEFRLVFTEVPTPIKRRRSMIVPRVITVALDPRFSKCNRLSAGAEPTTEFPTLESLKAGASVQHMIQLNSADGGQLV